MATRFIEINKNKSNYLLEYWFLFLDNEYRFRNGTGSRRKFKRRCCWRKKIAYTIFAKKGYFRVKLDPFAINLQSLGDFMTQEPRIRAIFFSSGAAVLDALRKYFIPRHWSDKPCSNHLELVARNDKTSFEKTTPFVSISGSI